MRRVLSFRFIAASLVAVIIISILVMFSRSFQWQILDDGLIRSGILFPPWAESALEYNSSSGRNYTGLGILIEIARTYFGQNVLGYFLLNSIVLLSILVLVVVYLFRETREFYLALIIGILTFLLPTGPEVFLTLIKLEKFSALAILLFILGIHTMKQEKSSLAGEYLVTASFIVAILSSKETIIIYYLIITLVTLRNPMYRKRINEKKYNKSFFPLYVLSSIFLVVKYIDPLTSSNELNYTSKATFSFAAGREHLIGYLFRNPYTFLLFSLMIVLLIIGYALKIETNAMTIALTISVTLELVFYLFVWTSAQIYYLYNIELFCLIGIATQYSTIQYLSKKSIRNRFGIAILTTTIFLYSLNVSYFRSSVLTTAHSIDSMLTNEFKKSRGELLLNFPEDLEIPINIFHLTGVPFVLTEEISKGGEYCGREILILYASQTNIVFGVRGVNWPTLIQQENDLRKSGVTLNRVESITRRSSYFVPGIGMPKLSSAFTLQPFPFEYGFAKERIVCLDK